MSALLLTVILVVLVTTLLLGYFYLIQRKHYDVTIAALGRVDKIRVRETATFAVPAGAEASGAASPARGKAPSPLTIEGTKTVAVGRRSEPFAVVDPLPTGSVVTWRVEPAAAAGLAPAASTTTLLPAVTGGLTVVATVADGSGTVTHQGSFATTAVEAPRESSLELPWVGQGVGTLVIMVMILGIVLYLAGEGVLDGAVVATIVTAVAGYVFGTRAATKG